MSRKRTDRLGQIGAHWLSKRATSPVWCRTWFDPTTRQVRRASLGTDDLEQAKLNLAEWIITAGSMRDERPEEVALETCLVRYYQHQARYLLSAEAARYSLRKWSDFFAAALVSDVTAERQREFVASMRAQSLSDGYIRRTLAVGQAALNRAHREGEIVAVPHIDLGLAPESEPRERILSVEEAARLLATADLDHLKMYLMLAFGTAARPAAILELTTFQVDCDARLIRLNPHERRQTKKRRPTVPMCNALLPFLRGLPAGPVVHYNGRPLNSIKSAFYRARERAGLTRDVTPYTLRHTVASEMRRRGVPVWEVAGFLGHSSGYRTTERYAKFGPDHLSQAVRAIDDLFANIWNAMRTLPGALFGDFAELHASRVLVMKPRIPQAFENMVEPDGIEPTTSTMPL